MAKSDKIRRLIQQCRLIIDEDPALLSDQEQARECFQFLEEAYRTEWAINKGLHKENRELHESNMRIMRELQDEIQELKLGRKDYPFYKRLQEVLIRNAGATRLCPHCKKDFIPNDITAQESLNMHNEIFGEE